MSGQHTPGPWKIDQNAELPLAIIESGEMGYGIAEIGERNPINLANARLIAAAPDLLAALKALLAESKNMTAAGDMARAAITRATTNRSPTK